MRKHSTLLIIFPVIFLLSSCAFTPASKMTEGSSVSKKGDQEKSNQLPAAQVLQIPIGTVHMVDQAGKFVLIKSSRTTSLEPETKIIAYGPDAQVSSQLKASPARKGAYLTADLVEGLPSVGDLVMKVHTISRDIQQSSPFGENPGAGMNANVQVLE